MGDQQPDRDRTSNAEVSSRRAPGPAGILGLRGVIGFLRDPLQYFLGLQSEWDGIARGRAGPFLFHTIFDPSLVREALVVNHDCYTKRGVIDELLPLLGNGLLASEGESWKARREAVAPLLTRRSMESLLPAMEVEADSVVARWNSTDGQPQIVNSSVDAMHFAISVIGRVLFGLDLTDRAASISDAVESVARLALQRSSALVKLPLRFPTPANRAYSRAIAELDEIVFGGIRAVERTDECLFHQLKAVIDPSTGKQLTETDLRDESMSLLLAGHETTANTFAWILDHLGREREWQERARTEARETLASLESGKTLGSSPMPIIDAIVSEALRLAPPAWLIMRRALVDHEVGGYRIPKGSFVSIPIHAIQRNPAYWEEPELFNPARFLEKAESELEAFLPFGMGPRRCPGEFFARAETRILLAKVLTHFELESVAPSPKPQPLATLRPAEHVCLRAVSRGPEQY